MATDTDRYGIGIAAFGGVIVASCVSALPSASCNAMAQTYFHAAYLFGMGAVAGLLASSPMSQGAVWLKYMMIGTGAIFMMVGILATQQALDSAISQCWTDGTANPAFQDESVIRWALRNILELIGKIFSGLPSTEPSTPAG
jgi:hypothetical protein